MYEFPYGGCQQLNLNWIINEIITLHKQLDPDWELPQFDTAFPYSNLNTLNLDWILRELKAIQELAPPAPNISSDNVDNASDITGATVTDALNAINDDLAEVSGFHMLPFSSGETVIETFLNDELALIDGSGLYFARRAYSSPNTQGYFGTHAVNMLFYTDPSKLYVSGIAFSDSAKQFISFRKRDTLFEEKHYEFTSSNVSNESNVTGATVTDALNNLNSTLTTLFGKDFEFRGEVATGTDIDTLYQNGWYELAYSGTYSNIPEVSGTVGQRHIYIYSEENPSLIKYKFMYYVNYKTGVVGFRIKASMVWQPWRVIQGAINNTVNYTKTFSPAGVATTPPDNRGKRVKICQYNVANYNKDTSTYLPDNKILNFRRFLAQEKFDFLLTQEDREYIDANNTKSSLQYLHYPMLNEYYCFNEFNQTIHCNQLRDTSFPAYKFKMPNSNSQSRRIQVLLTNIAGKKVLLISAHCSWRDFDADDPTSAANIAARLAQYQAIYNWENGTSTLHRIDNDAEVSCPSHDIAVICMDANCVTDTDKNNLLNLFNANGWQAGNGGRFGWFDSDIWNEDVSGMVSLDFCAVKGDVIINDCRPLYEWFPLLYSDHVPVEFDITILNPTADTVAPTFDSAITSNATYQSVSVKDGVASVKLYLTAASDISGGIAKTLATGLPIPNHMYQIDVRTTDGTSSFRLRINSSGELEKWYGDAIANGAVFIIDTVYFST